MLPNNREDRNGREDREGAKLSLRSSPPARRSRFGVWQRGGTRKIILLLVLAFVWEAYARALNNDLLFPTLSELHRVICRCQDGTAGAEASAQRDGMAW